MKGQINLSLYFDFDKMLNEDLSKQKYNEHLQEISNFIIRELRLDQEEETYGSYEIDWNLIEGDDIDE